MINLVLILFVALFMIVTAPANDASAGEVASQESSAPSPVIGQIAPDFTAVDSHGATHTLAQHRGSPVVLEWTNGECPFVRKHYDTGAMQKLQEEATKNGIVWLTINSSAEGKHGFASAEQANALIGKEKAHQSAYLLDPTGAIGHKYGASTTPHMFVINADGVLVYAGAIDDQPSTNPETLKAAKNYVKAALDDLKAGRAVQTASTQAYGCGIKY